MEDTVMKYKLTAGIAALMLCSIPLLYPAAGRKKAEAARQTPVAVTGLVTIFGNEPHTWTGFTTTDGTVYRVTGDPELTESLPGRQGIMLEITGYLEAPEPADGNETVSPVSIPGTGSGTIHITGITEKH